MLSLKITYILFKFSDMASARKSAEIPERVLVVHGMLAHIFLKKQNRQLLQFFRWKSEARNNPRTNQDRTVLSFRSALKLEKWLTKCQHTVIILHGIYLDLIWPINYGNGNLHIIISDFIFWFIFLLFWVLAAYC